jgi:hypothetical protein
VRSKTNHRGQVGLALAGWAVILVLSALLLGEGVHVSRSSNPAIVLVSAFAIWSVYSVYEIAIYFLNAWQRIPPGTNRNAYIAWMAFESLAASSVLILIASLFQR